MDAARSTRYLTLDEAADRLSVQPSTLARYCREGFVPAVRLPGPNGQFRIAEADLVLALRPAVETRSVRSRSTEFRGGR